MLDFYYKFHNKNFLTKSRELSNELKLILTINKVKPSSSSEILIDCRYEKILGQDLFSELNDLYYSIKLLSDTDPFLLKYLDSVKVEPHSDYQFADFFCGAGGLSEGIIQAGFDPVFVNDHNISSLETHYFNHNLSIRNFYGIDIEVLEKEIDSIKHLFKNIKLVAGGPPCQGFSMANRQPLCDDPRNSLYKFFLNMISYIKPDWFIMENVRGMRNKESEIEKDIRIIAGSEYNFLPLVLNAKDFGVPQNRERYFLIGNRIGISMLEMKMKFDYVSKCNKQYVLSDSLFGLPNISTNRSSRSSSIDDENHGFRIRKFTPALNDYISEINQQRGIHYLLNHKSRFNNENDLEIYKRLKQGEDSTAESIQDILKYKNRKDIFKDKYKKLNENDVCKTITSHMKYDCHMYIHPTQVRGLSPREAARIQSFPDDYYFRGNLNDWYYQIGNAVPVKLAKIIASTIKSFYA